MSELTGDRAAEDLCVNDAALDLFRAPTLGTYEVTVEDSTNPMCMQRETYTLRAGSPECAKSAAASEYLNSLPPYDETSWACIEVVSCRQVAGRARSQHGAAGAAA